MATMEELLAAAQGGNAPAPTPKRTTAPSQPPSKKKPTGRTIIENPTPKGQWEYTQKEKVKQFYDIGAIPGQEPSKIAAENRANYVNQRNAEEAAAKKKQKDAINRGTVEQVGASAMNMMNEAGQQFLGVAQAATRPIPASEELFGEPKSVAQLMGPLGYPLRIQDKAINYITGGEDKTPGSGFGQAQKFTQSKGYVWEPGKSYYTSPGTKFAVDAIEQGGPSAVVSLLTLPLGGAGFISVPAIVAAGSTYNQVLNDADAIDARNKQMGLPPIPARDKLYSATSQAVIEGLDTAFSNALDLVFFKMGKVATPALRSTMRPLLERSWKAVALDTAKGLIKDIPAEWTTETVQGYLQGKIGEHFKTSGPAPNLYETAKQTFGPTLFTTVLMGSGMGMMNHAQRQQTYLALTNPDVAPEIRQQAAQLVAENIKDPEMRDHWEMVASEAISPKSGGKPKKINVDMNLANEIANQPNVEDRLGELKQREANLNQALAMMEKGGRGSKHTVVMRKNLQEVQARIATVETALGRNAKPEAAPVTQEAAAAPTPEAVSAIPKPAIPMKIADATIYNNYRTRMENRIQSGEPIESIVAEINEDLKDKRMANYPELVDNIKQFANDLVTPKPQEAAPVESAVAVAPAPQYQQAELITEAPVEPMREQLKPRQPVLNMGEVGANQAIQPAPQEAAVPQKEKEVAAEAEKASRPAPVALTEQEEKNLEDLANKKLTAYYAYVKKNYPDMVIWNHVLYNADGTVARNNNKIWDDFENQYKEPEEAPQSAEYTTEDGKIEEAYNNYWRGVVLKVKKMKDGGVNLSTIDQFLQNALANQPPEFTGAQEEADRASELKERARKNLELRDQSVGQEAQQEVVERQVKESRSENRKLGEMKFRNIDPAILMQNISETVNYFVTEYGMPNNKVRDMLKAVYEERYGVKEGRRQFKQDWNQEELGAGKNEVRAIRSRGAEPTIEEETLMAADREVKEGIGGPSKDMDIPFSTAMDKTKVLDSQGTAAPSLANTTPIPGRVAAAAPVAPGPAMAIESQMEPAPVYTKNPTATSKKIVQESIKNHVLEMADLARNNPTLDSDIQQGTPADPVTVGNKYWDEATNEQREVMLREAGFSDIPDELTRRSKMAIPVMWVMAGRPDKFPITSAWIKEKFARDGIPTYSNPYAFDLMGVLGTKPKPNYPSWFKFDAKTRLPDSNSIKKFVQSFLGKTNKELEDYYVILGDADFFKSINEIMGHPVGDEVLGAIGAGFNRFMKSTDVVGRFGGEEFLGIIHKGNLNRLVMTAMAVGQSYSMPPLDVNGNQLLDESGNPVPGQMVTMSFGVAQATQRVAKTDQDGKPILDEAGNQVYDYPAIKKADQLLSQAKKSGRNKIVVDNAEIGDYIINGPTINEGGKEYVQQYDIRQADETLSRLAPGARAKILAKHLPSLGVEEQSSGRPDNETGGRDVEGEGNAPRGEVTPAPAELPADAKVSTVSSPIATPVSAESLFNFLKNKVWKGLSLNTNLLRVVNDVSEINDPEAKSVVLEHEKNSNGLVRAYYNPNTGEVWFVAKNIKDLNQAANIYIHEIWHKGISEFEGGDRFLTDVWFSKGNSRVPVEVGGEIQNVTMSELASMFGWETDVTAGMDSDTRAQRMLNRRRAANEWIALQVENGKLFEPGMRSIYNRLVKVVKDFLRTRLNMKLSLSDPEMKAVITRCITENRAENSIEKGPNSPVGTRGAVSYSTTKPTTKIVSYETQDGEFRQVKVPIEQEKSKALNGQINMFTGEEVKAPVKQEKPKQLGLFDIEEAVKKDEDLFFSTTLDEAFAAASKPPREDVLGAAIAAAKAQTPATDPAVDADGEFVTGVRDNLAYKILDDFGVVRNFEKNLKSRGGIVDKSTYTLRYLFTGRTVEKMRVFAKIFATPIYDILAKARKQNISYNDVSLYLWARHAPERNARIATINPDLQDGGSGMTNAQAAAIIQAYKSRGPEVMKLLDDAAMAVDMIVAEDRRVRTGDLATPDQIDSYVNARGVPFKYYVSLRKGEMEGAEEGPIRARTGKKFNIIGSEARRSLGTSSKIDALIFDDLVKQIKNTDRKKNPLDLDAINAPDPLTMTILQAHEGIIRKEKNEIFKRFYQMVLDNPELTKGVVTINPAKMVKVFNPKTGVTNLAPMLPGMTEEDVIKQVGQYGIVQYRKMQLKNGNVFAGKINGQEVYLEIHDPILAKALVSASQRNDEWIDYATSSLKNTMRVYASLLTTANPAWMIVNIFRDVWTGTLNTSADMGFAKGIQVPFRAIAAATGIVEKQMREGWVGEKTGISEEATTYWGKRVQQYIRQGGKINPLGLQSVEDVHDDLKAASRKYNSITDTDIVGLVRPLWNLLERVGEISELSTRVAMFDLALKEGKTEEEAALYGKEGTVNFEQKGSMFRWGNGFLNSLYLFSSANIAGNVRLGKALTARQGRDVAALIYIAGILIAESSRNALGDDPDDGKSKWSKISPFTKSRNILLAWGDHRVSIPMAYGWNVFLYMGYLTSDVLNGDITPAEGAAATVGAITEAFNPFGSETSPDLSRRIWKIIMPTIGDPFLQLAFNEDPWGRKIKPEQSQWGDKKIGSELHFKNVSPASHAFADWLNKATIPLAGKDALQGEGLISWSPSKFDYFARAVTGGAGKFVLDSLQLLDNMSRGEETELFRTPVKRSFTFDTEKVRPYDEYKKRYDYTDSLIREYKSLGKEGDAQRIADFRKENEKFLINYLTPMQILQISRGEDASPTPKTGNLPYLKMLEKTIKDLTKQKKEVEEDKSLSTDAKRDKIKDIEARRNKAEKNFTFFVDTLRGGAVPNPPLVGERGAKDASLEYQMTVSGQKGLMNDMREIAKSAWIEKNGEYIPNPDIAVRDKASQEYADYYEKNKDQFEKMGMSPDILNKLWAVPFGSEYLKGHKGFYKKLNEKTAREYKVKPTVTKTKKAKGKLQQTVITR